MFQVGSFASKNFQTFSYSPHISWGREAVSYEQRSMLNERLCRCVFAWKSFCMQFQVQETASIGDDFFTGSASHGMEPSHMSTSYWNEAL